MSSTINASTASGGGVITTADASGILQLQTAGTTALTIDASQNVTFANPPAIVGTNINGTSNSLNAGLGVNQTWQNVTRVIGTTYTNSTGKPITVAISYTNSAANTVQGLVIAGATVYASGCPVANFGSGFTLVVPNGATYVTTTNAGTMTLVTWAELR